METASADAAEDVPRQNRYRRQAGKSTTRKKTKPLDTKKITLSDNKILKIFTAKFYYIK